mmetsp:Transcript_43587/g.141445  ORF Transcript_43587/g.141445 Transcript_43587/m.141445 type:complete len:238 (-) Transcript_43587:450-1163(-)
MPTYVTRCRRSTLAPASRSEARRCWWPRRSSRCSAPSSASRRSSTSLRPPSCALASPPPPPRRCCCSLVGRSRFPPPWAASARSSCSARGACLCAVSGSCAPPSALRGAPCCSPSVRGAPRMRARPRSRCSRSGETSILSCLGCSSRTGPSVRRWPTAPLARGRCCCWAGSRRRRRSWRSRSRRFASRPRSGASALSAEPWARLRPRRQRRATPARPRARRSGSARGWMRSRRSTGV